MEPVCSVPFSSVVATLLLDRRFVTAREIVNFESKISLENDIYVDDDDISFLSICVDIDKNYNFKIKSNLNYDSIIGDGITVRQFLEKNSISNEIFQLVVKEKDSLIDSVVLNNDADNDLYILNPKKRVRIQNFIKDGD